MANVAVINFNDHAFQKKVVDKFYQESVIGGRTSKAYTWDGAKAIDVITFVTQDPVDYYRPSLTAEASADSTRNLHRYGIPTDVEDTKQHMEITQDKSVSMVVDKGDNKQTSMIRNAGKILGLEIREKFVPMVDKYALAQWNTNRGGYTVCADANLTKSTIVDEIGKHVTMFGNNFVSIDDAICYIGYTNFAKLLGSSEFLNLEKLGTKALADGAVGKVRGLDIKPIPDSYLPDGVQFMTVKKESVLLPFQIKETKIHQDVPGISGALMEVRYLYDAFVLETLNKGVISCVKTQPSA